MQAVGETIIVKLIKEKTKNGETVMDNGLIAVGTTGDNSVMELLSKWEGTVISVGEKVKDSPVKENSIVRITENSGIPISEEETDTETIRYVSVRYGDVIAVM